jgi:cell division protein FtsB
MAKKGIAKAAIFIAIGLVIFLPPFAKYQELRAKNKSLERQLKAVKEETKRLEEEKMRLETDITYIEQKAREKMGVVKKGEIILKESPAKK